MMKIKASFFLYVLVFLSLEKFIQHMFVTYAFAVDMQGIRSTVIPDYRFLMVTGCMVGVLFLLNALFLFQRRTNNLMALFCLALFDVLGEFFAQGTLAIQMTVSFVVATFILVFLVVTWRRL